ncbi:MAG TPA: divergent polysaccharide deacetylase family protein [Alphaproteobacteria bacterium]
MAGSNVVELPLVERLAAAAQAPPPAAVPSPPPKLITSHEDPQVVYEEVTPESLAGKQSGGAPERETKPALLANLSNFASKPIDGPKPLWLRNAQAIPDTHGRPIVALVIDDVGLDRKRAERAMHLPAPVTLSFMTYAPEVSVQAHEASSLGHELMVHFPMEPDNARVDPGPHALRVGENAAEIEENLNWGLGQFSGYVAINNHMGSKFTRDAEGMRVVMRELKARGLFFLDSRTTSATVGPAEARDVGLPYLERDIFLDNVDTREAVAARLAEVEHTAHRYGYAIAIGHPRDVTLDVLEKWTAEVSSRGLALVPISAVMRLKLTADPAKVSG